MKVSKANYKLLVLVIFTAIACAAAARDMPKSNEIASTKDMVVPHSVDDDQGGRQEPWRGGMGRGGISGSIGAGGSGGIGGGLDIGGLGGRFSGSTGGGLGGSIDLGPRDGGGVQAGVGVGAGLGGSVSGSGAGRFGGGFGGDDGSGTP